jgi:hypothetical protein
MKRSDKQSRPQSMADIERAAWFARLAFGAPSAYIERPPVKPRQKSIFSAFL